MLEFSDIDRLLNYPAWTGGPSISQHYKDTAARQQNILAALAKLDTINSKIDGLPAKIPLTVQGASEQYIQDRCDNLYKTIATIVNTTSGNVIIDGRNNRDQILNRINAL